MDKLSASVDGSYRNYACDKHPLPLLPLLLVHHPYGISPPPPRLRTPRW